MITASPSAQRKMKKGSSSGQHIKVFVRIRPANEGEKLAAVTCSLNKEIVVQERTLDKFTKKFSFDRVFDTKSKQVDIFKSVAKPLVDEVLNGYNCTIFAYGQTGTGKTYTMEGEHYQETFSHDDNVSGAGIIPRCVNQLFDELRIKKLEFTMRVSFLELYNEELFDLLSAHDDLSKLRLYEDSNRKGSCVIQGLEEVLVRNKLDVFRIIEKGTAKRQTAATLMNAHSSRSHTVFTVTVHIKENTEEDELLKTGKLHLVDLAGSENIGRSGAVDKRAREAGNINQSLLTLGRVITSLVEKAPHIPYRESKLTRLLQDALGGRTKTSIIATISPAQINIEETLSTLDYAHRAKNIQNKPEVNQKLNKKELICEYTNEIEKLRRDVLAMREKDGFYVAKENYEEMISTRDLQMQEISEKISEIRRLEEELEKQMELFNEKMVELDSVNEKLSSTEFKLSQTKGALQSTQTLLTQTASDRDEQKYLVSAQAKTESTLHAQGKGLIHIAETTTSDISKLQDKLDRKRKVETLNDEVEKSFERDFKDKISAMHGSLQAFHNYHHSNSSTITEALAQYKVSNTTNIDSLLSALMLMNSAVMDALQKSNSFIVSKTSEATGNASKWSNSIDERALREKDSVCAFMEAVFNPLVSQLSELMLTQSDSLQCLETNIRDESKKVELLCQNAHEKNSSILSSIEERLSEVTEYPSLILSEMRSKSDAVETKSRSHTQRMKSLSQKMILAIEEHENFLASQTPLLSQGHQEKLNNMEEASLEVLKDIRNLSELSSEHVEQSLETGQEVVASLLKGVQQIKDKSNEAEKKIAFISSNVEETLKSTQESFDQLSASSVEYKAKSLKYFESTKEEIDEKSKEFSEGITVLYKATTMDVTSLKDYGETSIADIDEKLTRSESELEEFLVDHHDQLKESEENVHHFINSLVTDIPTGQTPVRKEYAFSSSLAATSPHETLMKRFRIRRNYESKIPLPQLTQEGEDDQNSPLSSSSSASCNSSMASENENIIPSGTSTNIVQPLSRSGSFKDSREFAYPTIPVRQESRDDIPRISISRSSSSSSLTDSKENVYTNSRKATSTTKKRETKHSSATVSNNITDKLSSEAQTTRARKVLGPFN